MVNLLVFVFLKKLLQYWNPHTSSSGHLWWVSCTMVPYDATFLIFMPLFNILTFNQDLSIWVYKTEYSKVIADYKLTKKKALQRSHCPLLVYWKSLAFDKPVTLKVRLIWQGTQVSSPQKQSWGPPTKSKKSMFGSWFFCQFNPVKTITKTGISDSMETVAF